MNLRTLIASAALAALAAAQPANAAGILNGHFSNGLEGWTSEGDVTAVSTHGFVYVRMQETFAPTPDDPESQRKPQASRSRLYQDFVVPEDATNLAFRFRLASTPRTRNSPVPPDAFTAHLLDASGARVLLGTVDAPKFSSAFFYIDSDRNLVYDSEHVTVQPMPGSDGMYGVTLQGLNSPNLIAETLRLEFNFATANNGVTSAIFMDGVADGSAFVCPIGYCCDAIERIVGGPINDSDPCTVDSCVGAMPVHEEIPCCDGCAPNNTAGISIAIIVDASSSMSTTDFELVRTAIVNITEYLDLAEPNGEPEIMVGRFSEGLETTLGGPPERIEQGKYWAVVDVGFTTDYASVRNALQGDNSSFQKVENNTQDRTSPLESGIVLADAKLAELIRPSGHRKYVLIVTDGWTNFSLDDFAIQFEARDWMACGLTSPASPACCSQYAGEGTPPDPPAHVCCYPEAPSQCDIDEGPEYCTCECTPARDLARYAAISAKDTGVKIAVAHVLSTGSTICNQATFIDSAKSFLEDEIASDGLFIPDQVSPSEERIACAFFDLIDAITCDDGNAATIDECQTDGTCSHLSPPTP